MPRIDTDALPKEAWRPAETAKGRASNRVSERELTRIPAHLDLRGGKRVPVELWDFSLHGFAVLLPPRVPAELVPVDGERVRITLDWGDGPLHAECMVKNISRMKGRTRLGLARRDLSRRSPNGPEIGVPEGECLRFPESLDIRAEAANPVLFGESSFLILAGARPGFRLEFICRDPSMPLFQGQKVELGLMLPSSGGNTFSGRITHLEFAPGCALRMRLEPVEVGSGLANDLAELLANEAKIPPETLQRFAFPTRFFRNRVSFRFVEDMEDYAAVLNLRRNAYVEAGKRDADTVPEEMSLAWDRSSRILCAYHDGTLVASAALTFPEGENATLRSETVFPGNRWPGEPPPKAETMEVNSLCTHKDYRKGDLLRAMFEQIGRIFILSDRKYIMNLADGNLLPMYLGIGFKALGYEAEFLGRTHHLIKLKRNMVVNAEGIGWLRWNLLYADIMRDLVTKGLIGMGALDRARMAIRLAFGPFARLTYAKRGERAFVRKMRETKKE